jgi:uncharacterized phage protein gp47/JayE
MILPLQKFSTLLENMAAAVQGGSAALVDVSVGSVLRALLEACGAVALWMQWLILQVLSMTRAATSNASDLDSWMADFGLIRLPGSASAGVVDFGRYTAGVGATIPVGSLVYTADRTQAFSVIAQSSNPAWNGNGGYLLGSAATDVLVPVQAVTPGRTGNILAGAIGWLASAVPGVDYVSNAQPFVGGLDPESDAALRTRFQLYINSRSLATVSAVEFAVASLQQGLRYMVLENVNAANQPLAGNFWVVVDDGTGAPGDMLLANASAAVDAVRPIGATYAVTGPAVLQASVQMAVVTSNPLTHLTVCAAIESAIGVWVAGLPMAGTLAISKLDALAHNVDPSVTSVAVTRINGGTADLAASPGEVIIATSVTVG